MNVRDTSPTFSGFIFSCLLNALISSKKKEKAKELFPGPALASKQAFSAV
jgi:hypothetical protein